MPNRYSSAGLAHAAADEKTAATGIRHVMAFQPNGRHDRTPFVVKAKQ